MTRRAGLLRRLRANERATAVVEFALTAPVFLLILMGIFDFCWQMYAQQVLQGAVSKAGRDATLQSNALDQSALDDRVEAEVLKVFKNAEVGFTRLAYDRFDQVGVEERYTDANNNDQYDAGECYDDFNGNGHWDADRIS